MKRQLHLNLFIHSRGHHEASWRHPASSPLPLTDIRYYQDLAQRGRGGAVRFDLSRRPAGARRGCGAGAAHLARTDHRAGGAGGVDQPDRADRHRSTTYTEPFNLARQFASIDHISNGRAGWNIVTSWLAAAARELSAAPGRSATPTATPAARNSWRW